MLEFTSHEAILSSPDVCLIGSKVIGIQPVNTFVCGIMQGVI
jgi:hypothetical protein